MSDYTIQLSLVEHQASHYTFATQTQVASTINYTTKSFYNSTTSIITLSDEMIEYADGVVITRLNILIGASTDQFVQYYQVEAKKAQRQILK